MGKLAKPRRTGVCGLDAPIRTSAAPQLPAGDRGRAPRSARSRSRLGLRDSEGGFLRGPWGRRGPQFVSPVLHRSSRFLHCFSTVSPLLLHRFSAVIPPFLHWLSTTFPRTLRRHGGTPRTPPGAGLEETLPQVDGGFSALSTAFSTALAGLSTGPSRCPAPASRSRRLPRSGRPAVILSSLLRRRSTGPGSLEGPRRGSSRRCRSAGADVPGRPDGRGTANEPEAGTHANPARRTDTDLDRCSPRHTRGTARGRRDSTETS